MSAARELKERALAIDPVIDWERPDAEEIGNGRSEDASDPVRLSEWVEEIGWGRTLASFPAARKFMSELAEGEAMSAAREALFDAFKPWTARPTPEEANDLIDAHRAEVLREAADLAGEWRHSSPQMGELERKLRRTADEGEAKP